MKNSRLALLLGAILAGNGCSAPRLEPDAAALAPVRYAEGRELCRLEISALRESSGLARSHRVPEVFWTHNDSGGRARVYAFDLEGRPRGVFTVPGAANVDWEDMASFRTGRQSYLLCADTGDNRWQRRECALYLFPEPAPIPARTVKAKEDASENAQTRSTVVATQPAEVIKFSFEGGPQDCEAVAVDPRTLEVYLVNKVMSGAATVFKLRRLNPGKERPGGAQLLLARRIASFQIPLVTALDIAPEGTRAMVLTYGDAYEFTRRAGESWAQAFSRRPRRVKMPRRYLGEALCFGADGRTLYLTSEQTPTPFWEVPPATTKPK